MAVQLGVMVPCSSDERGLALRVRAFVMGGDLLSEPDWTNPEAQRLIAAYRNPLPISAQVPALSQVSAATMTAIKWAERIRELRKAGTGDAPIEDEIDDPSAQSVPELGNAA